MKLSTVLVAFISALAQASDVSELEKRRDVFCYDKGRSPVSWDAAFNTQWTLQNQDPYGQIEMKSPSKYVWDWDGARMCATNKYLGGQPPILTNRWDMGWAIGRILENCCKHHEDPW